MKQFANLTFDRANKNCAAWFVMANSLLHSALSLRTISFKAKIELQDIEGGYVEPGYRTERILKDRLIVKQATMLFGFAIENALKGLWIEKFKIDSETPVDRLPEKIKNHNLESLAEDVNISLNKNERKVLNQLTESILWAGRYPIPINVNRYQEHFKSRLEFFIENSTINELPLEIESLMDKINEKIAALD